MHDQNLIPKKPLLLALLVGICGDASLSALTEPAVPFSFFPMIALVLALVIFHNLRGLKYQSHFYEVNAAD